MFTHLIASRPAPQRSTNGAIASVAVHGVLVAAAVYLTVGAATPPAPPVQQRLFYVPPASPPPTPPSPRVAATAPRGAPLVAIPVSLPLMLPPATFVHTRLLLDLAPTMRFIPGGRTVVGEPVGEVGGGPSGVPYLADQVEVAAAVAKGSPLPRFPAALRSVGIDGVARFQFVVDSAGRVELSTVQALESTHEAFAFAVRSTLPRMRFTPAELGGRPVRQLVELPFVFRFTR